MAVCSNSGLRKPTESWSGTNFGLERDGSVWIKYTLFMKYRDISLYRDNASKYSIACDYPISPSSNCTLMDLFYRNVPQLYFEMSAHMQ